MDDRQLTVLVERCVIEINANAFFNTEKLKNIYKFFGYTFQESYRNIEAIEYLGTYLPSLAHEAKEHWHEASMAFRDGYVDIQYGYCRDKKTAERNNKKLREEVKRAKIAYDRKTKILAHFENIKSKKLSTPNENN
ncbi:MAG: hypothetical protein HFE63_11105 [Clostridiales bacterium]|nr:hypothetical protein [Clostridiales bacterium]